VLPFSEKRNGFYFLPARKFPIINHNLLPGETMPHPLLYILAIHLLLAPPGNLEPDGRPERVLENRIVFEDGSCYTGSFTSGKKEGFGIYLWPDGSEYRGEFRDGVPDGEGLYLYADGRRKRVTYQNGSMQKAFMVSNAVRLDGAEYGEYDFNGHYSGWFRGSKVKGYVPHGRGAMRYLNGSVYTGQWDNGKMHGNGKIVWEDGAVYSGQWLQGKRTGYGSYTWANGDRYVGRWKENQLYGPGTFYHSDGTVEKRVWMEKTIVME